MSKSLSLLISQLGGFYIWTYTYQLIKSSALKYKAGKAAQVEALTEPNKDLDADVKSHLLEANAQEHDSVSVDSTESTEDDVENQKVSPFILLTFYSNAMPKGIQNNSLATPLHEYKFSLLKFPFISCRLFLNDRLSSQKNEMHHS